MAIRPFAGIQTVAGGSAQPVFGTKLTAASNYSIDRFTGTNRIGTSTPPIQIEVDSSAGFQVGDRVLVGPAANFTQANRILLDQGTVASIVSATAITVQGLVQNHAIGEYLVLNETASFMRLIPISVAASFYVGTDSTASSTDSSVYATGTPTYWSPLVLPTATGCTYQTCEAWLLGTAADTFVASFYQV